MTNTFTKVDGPGTVYEGTKQLTAWPMTRDKYCRYRGWVLPLEEEADTPGYLVEYADGGKPNDRRHESYISWSPADVFERTYKAVNSDASGIVTVDTDKLTPHGSMIDNTGTPLDIDSMIDNIGDAQDLLKYQALFDALCNLTDPEGNIQFIGSGPERDAVQAAFDDVATKMGSVDLSPLPEAIDDKLHALLLNYFEAVEGVKRMNGEAFDNTTPRQLREQSAKVDTLAQQINEALR